MSIVVKRGTEYETSIWSGGKTTEMCINPPTAIYKEQDFSYRISSATINNEVSTFTSLPKYQRILLVLEGQVELQHIEKNTKRTALLKQGEQDSFSGANETTSVGKCTDFNLIYQPHLTGAIEHIVDEEDFLLKKGTDCLIYCTENMAIVLEKKEEAVESIVLDKGDSVHVYSEKEDVRVTIKIEYANKQSKGLKTTIQK